MHRCLCHSAPANDSSGLQGHHARAACDDAPEVHTTVKAGLRCTKYCLVAPLRRRYQVTSFCGIFRSCPFTCDGLLAPRCPICTSMCMQWRPKNVLSFLRCFTFLPSQKTTSWRPGSSTSLRTSGRSICLYISIDYE